MSMSDPVSDMLTRIRNAGMAGHAECEMPLSKLKASIAAILKKEGYISDFQVVKDNVQGVLRIDLKYDGREPVIAGLRRVSKPGCRVYVKSDNIPTVMSGLGLGVISTSRGVVSDREARKQGIGGEYLCEVW